MSYNQYPARSSVELKVGDHTQELFLEGTAHQVPPKIEQYLLDIGWTYAMQDPNTYETLFQKHADMDAGTLYYRWHEAVAYELWRFLTLNSGNDE